MPCVVNRGRALLSADQNQPLGLPQDYLRRRNGVTIGENSTLGAAVLNALNWLGFKNMTLHWLQAKNWVS